MPISRAVSLRKRSWTTTRSRLASARSVELRVGMREQDVPADHPQPSERSLRRGLARSASRPVRGADGTAVPTRLSKRGSWRRRSGRSPSGGRARSPCGPRPGRCSGRASGFTPAPGFARFPVSSARFAKHMTMSVPCSCSVIPRPWKEIAGVSRRRRGERRGECRSGSTPQIAATASGVKLRERRLETHRSRRPVRRRRLDRRGPRR